jgi:uncharacterized SAM-binding protein YcdF (DUF218 family)
MLLLGALALAACVSVLPFVLPHPGDPADVDAVVVLSGDHGDRLRRAMELMDRRVAPTLVLNGTPDSRQVLDLCARSDDFEVVCLRPQPDNTRNEARAAAQLATERGWRGMAVVTTSHHVPRAALLFRRCFDGAVHMAGSKPQYGWRMSARQVVHEWAGVAWALTVRRGC